MTGLALHAVQWWAVVTAAAAVVLVLLAGGQAVVARWRRLRQARPPRRGQAGAGSSELRARW